VKSRNKIAAGSCKFEDAEEQFIIRGVAFFRLKKQLFLKGKTFDSVLLVPRSLMFSGSVISESELRAKGLKKHLRSHKRRSTRDTPLRTYMYYPFLPNVLLFGAETAALGHDPAENLFQRRGICAATTTIREPMGI
jgi:hypothetical protein